MKKPEFYVKKEQVKSKLTGYSKSDILLAFGFDVLVTVTSTAIVSGVSYGASWLYGKMTTKKKAKKGGVKK